jgi:hypothetical protein
MKLSYCTLDCLDCEEDAHIQTKHGEFLCEPVSVGGLQGSLYVCSRDAEAQVYRVGLIGVI